MNCEYVDILQSPPFSHVHAEYTQQYFSVSGLPVVIDVERCGTIISREKWQKRGTVALFLLCG